MTETTTQTKTHDVKHIRDKEKSEMIKNIALELLNVLNVRCEENATEDFHAGHVAINTLVTVVGNAIKNLTPPGKEKEGVEIFVTAVNAWLDDVKDTKPEEIKPMH